MRELVVDSGVVLRASGSADARATLDGFTLIAPPLLWSEVTSAVHEALWRKEITRDRAQEVRKAVKGLGLRRECPSRLHDVAWEIAEELGWAKTYDAEFLALARLRKTQVVTTDARLLRGAERTGLVIDPSRL